MNVGTPDDIEGAAELRLASIAVIVTMASRCATVEWVSGASTFEVLKKVGHNLMIAESMLTGKSREDISALVRANTDIIRETTLAAHGVKH